VTTRRDRIFISYRRSEAAGSTTALRKTLVDRFGEASVFRDVEGIGPGTEFPKVLQEQLEAAAVVLAVIGKDWLHAANEFGQRRIDFDDDWVRTELSIALGNSEVTVIPVLVDGAGMPPARALPTSIVDLATRNAVVLHHDAWDDSARRLLETIARILKPGEARSPQPTPEVPTVDVLRQVVAEALAASIRPADHVLVATVDDISRIMARVTAKALDAEARAALELLLARLVRRPVARVDGYMKEVFGHTFSISSKEGRWLGYALFSSRPNSYVAHFRHCVLLRPSSSASQGEAAVTGIAVFENVELDYYGANTNDPPGPYVDCSETLIAIGDQLKGTP
jgi:hypothetical protein